MATKTRNRRDASMVRAFLRELPDKAGRHKPSLEKYARQYEIPETKLIAFRDGNDAALNKSQVAMFAGLLGSDAAHIGFNYDDEIGDLITGATRLGSTTPMAEDVSRLERFRLYDLMDEVRPECHSALSAWADMGVNGGNESAGEAFAPEVASKNDKLKQAIKEIGDNINKRLMPPDVKHQAFRGMCKFGDQWPELGLAQMGNGSYDIVQLAPRHVKTMYVKLDDDGYIDPAAAYIQKLPGNHQSVAEFPQWKIARFSNTVQWGDLYGQSVLFPCRRSFIQLESTIAAMLIRRLTRAPLRYHRIIDVGHLDRDQRETAVEEYKKKNKKVRTIDGDLRRGLMTITLPPEEDLCTAKSDKDSPAGIEPLEGDKTIDQIADVTEVILPQWFAGLGPPKAHLGWEGTTMRSVITDLHIVFARKVRHMQMRFLSGLNHLYWVSLILRGIDPRTASYRIVPPLMGTRDELIRAQVMQAYSTTIKYLADSFGMTGQVPSIQWFLRYILGLGDDAIDALELSKVVDLKKTSMKNDPASGAGSSEGAAMAADALTSDRVAKEAALLGIIMSERAIARRAERVLSVDDPFLQHNFAPKINVDRLAQSWGIRHLEKCT